jgi:hypothetical protein
VSLNIEVSLTKENDSGFNKSSLTEKVHKIMTNSACNRFNRLLSKDFQYSLITLLKYDMSIKKKREEIESFPLLTDLFIMEKLACFCFASTIFSIISIFRNLLSRDFVRLGRWYVQPFDGPERTLQKASHLSFTFHYFVHGESFVCASVDVRQHPAVRRLSMHHLNTAR